MSGVAKLLLRRGARVSGSDRAGSSPVAEALRGLGAVVRAGHAAAQLPGDASCVVVSSAIAEDNPELLRARETGVPVVRRAAALAALTEGSRTVAVAGTHGKTTTSSMLAVALRAIGEDVSYVIGADLDAPCSGAEQGRGELFVAEADESDHSFHAYRPETAVVLNIEFEHHANYGSLEEIYASFETFADRLAPGGTLVVCADHPGARELTRRVLAGPHPPRVLTYGESTGADVRITGVTSVTGITGITGDAGRGGGSRITVRAAGERIAFDVSVPGRHYAQDAVAALTAGLAQGVPAARLAPALARYTGARRRLEHKGKAAGVAVVDTYAHHPTEMAADLAALRAATGHARLLVAYQPHLYSRTRALGAAMGRALAMADAGLVLDIYPARERPVPGVDSRLVIDAAREAGADVADRVFTLAEAPAAIAALAGPGDVIVTMGGGDITTLGPEILRHLDDLARPR
ncbi:UDP-N-acetylmuramate--L-alanine ligase [Streptomyces boncukensis]|nr:UDP-N-acetylmuramate--L-alanine ligase [Streptomyces boncukensis]